MTVHHKEAPAQPRDPRPETPYFAAQQFAQLGFSPFPVRHRSKVPAVKWKGYAYNPVDFTRKYTRQSKDPDTGKSVTVRKTSLDREVNIALRTGYEYELAVLDFDVPKNFINLVRE